MIFTTNMSPVQHVQLWYPFNTPVIAGDVTALTEDARADAEWAASAAELTRAFSCVTIEPALDTSIVLTY